MLSGLILQMVIALSLVSDSPAKAQSGTPPVGIRIDSSGIHVDGIQPLDGADGSYIKTARGGSWGLTFRPGSNSSYLYFALSDTSRHEFAGPAYLRIEYFDGALGSSIQCDYDSKNGELIDDKFRHAESQAGGYYSGSGRWRTAIFALQQPLFHRRENLGADFRFSGGSLVVRSVSLLLQKPTDWDVVNRIEKIDIKPLVHIGAKGQLIVGGFDPARVVDAAPQAHALESSIPALKSLGVTSHECYVRWNLCEPEEGKYDWSVYDRYVDIYKKHGLRWVPFLIIGSAYSLPDWYYKKPGYQGYVCLEHHQESDVQSLWNPTLRRHVSRFIQAFCEHYRNSGVIESILLGITGNYGEAIYPVSGNDWTADIHGNYHSHPGIWAGDPFAIADFRKWLTTRYGNTEALRRAWGPNFTGELSSVLPMLKQQAPSDRAWLDQCAWYIGSMTDYARFWMHVTRANFPSGDIYLCTGGHAPIEHGSDFGEQCKAAAEVGGGVRITNESSDERGNFSLTRWVASAGRQYGAYFSFEPAGSVDANGVIARIFNATTSGARGLHYYYPNLFADDAARKNFILNGSQFQQRKPLVEIAVYYPETYILLNGNDFLRYVQSLRTSCDFDYMSDGQIRDGGLAHIKALVMLQGNVAEAPTWKRIGEWVKQGGTLYYASDIGPLKTVEGDTTPNSLVSTPNGANALGAGHVYRFEGSPLSPEYRKLITESLQKSPRISYKTRHMLEWSELGLFASVTTEGDVVLFNATDAPISMAQIQISPHTIRTISESTVMAGLTQSARDAQK